MQRLTENDGKGNWQLKGLPWEELAPGKELTAEACQLLYGALCKLKDLEDAGLHPKSAEAIDWLYLEKCKEVNELKKEDEVDPGEGTVAREKDGSILHKIGTARYWMVQARVLVDWVLYGG